MLKSKCSYISSSYGNPVFLPFLVLLKRRSIRITNYLSTRNAHITCKLCPNLYMSQNYSSCSFSHFIFHMFPGWFQQMARRRWWGRRRRWIRSICLPKLWLFTIWRCRRRNGRCGRQWIGRWTRSTWRKWWGRRGRAIQIGEEWRQNFWIRSLKTSESSNSKPPSISTVISIVL